MELKTSMMISAAGLRAQDVRMRVIAENLANANSVAPSPDAEPYRRKVVTFKNVLDKETGAAMVKVGRITTDKSEFTKRYDPGHPGADETGYVRMPNVNGMIEATDMRQAQRTYEANLNSIETARAMMMRTLDILRN